MLEYNSWEKTRKKRQAAAIVLFFIVLFGGWAQPLLGYFVPFCMLLGLGIAIKNGRKWCDWLCPRGSFYDRLIKPISPQREIPGLFKKLEFKIAILAIIGLILVANLVVRWPDPYKIGRFFIIMLTATTGLGVILGLFFHQRTWCYFCPVGFLSGAIGGRTHPLKIASGLCNDCQLCSRACPMQINPSSYRKQGTEAVLHNDCLRCNLCVLICPKKALTRK